MLERRIRKQIEKAFYGYKSLLAQGAEHIVEVAESGLTSNLASNGHGSGISNPTEKKAIRLLNGETSVQWCKVVENTLIAYKWQSEERIIRYKYFEKYSRAKTQMHLGISDRTYDYWIENILKVAEMWAVEFGLI